MPSNRINGWLGFSRKLLKLADKFTPKYIFHILFYTKVVPECISTFWPGITSSATSGHRRRCHWGTEARASSDFRTRRHAMERASSDFCRFSWNSYAALGDFRTNSHCFRVGKAASTTDISRPRLTMMHRGLQHAFRVSTVNELLTYSLHLMLALINFLATDNLLH